MPATKPTGASAIVLDHDESMDQGCISPNDVFSTFDVPISGSVPWGATIDSTAPGVYIVGPHRDRADGRGFPTPPIDDAALREWIKRVPLLRVAGQQLSPEALGKHIANWWLPNTSVLYIGKASVLQKRISQYLRTPIGAPGPHRGGQWLKVLAILPRLTVHYAELPPQWSKPEDRASFSACAEPARWRRLAMS